MASFHWLCITFWGEWSNISIWANELKHLGWIPLLNPSFGVPSAVWSQKFATQKHRTQRAAYLSRTLTESPNAGGPNHFEPLRSSQENDGMSTSKSMWTKTHGSRIHGTGLCTYIFYLQIIKINHPKCNMKNNIPSKKNGPSNWGFSVVGIKAASWPAAFRPETSNEWPLQPYLQLKASRYVLKRHRLNHGETPAAA